MKSYKQRLEKFLFNPYYMLSVIIIAILGYGFSLTHQSIGIDDLEYDRYLGEGHGMLAMGRFGRNFWAELFGNGQCDPFQAFTIDLISVLLLIAAAVQFCILLQQVSDNHFTSGGCILFSCLFISYPLINEIWEYTGTNLCACSGYLLTGLSIYAMFEVLHSRELTRGKRIEAVIFALICTTLICASFESLAIVYVLVVFTVLFLRTLYAPGERITPGKLIREGLIYAAVLLGGLVLRLAIHRGIVLFFHLSTDLTGDTEICWKTQPLRVVLKNLYYGFRYRFIDQAFWYFPMTVLTLCIAVFGCGLLINSIRQKNILRLLMGMGMIFSLFLLSLIQGKVSPNRTYQTHAFFSAFTILLVYSRIRKNKRLGNLFAIAMAILCVHQATFLSNIAAANYARSEYEADMIKTIGLDLRRAGYSSNKKLVFVGRIEIPDSIMDKVTLQKDQLRLYNKYRRIRGNGPCESVKYVETNVQSVLNWSIEAFNCDGLSVNKLFTYYGYDVSYDADHDLGDEAQEYVMGTLGNAVPKYPQDGYIIEYGDYVIVRLG